MTEIIPESSVIKLNMTFSERFMKENDSSQCNMQTKVAQCSRVCHRLKSPKNHWKSDSCSDIDC